MLCGLVRVAAIVGNLPESFMGLGVYILALILSSFAFFHETVSCSECRRICWRCYSPGLFDLLGVSFRVHWSYVCFSGLYGAESIIVNLCNGTGS